MVIQDLALYVCLSLPVNFCMSVSSSGGTYGHKKATRSTKAGFPGGHIP